MAEEKVAAATENAKEENPTVCGLMMPISPFGIYQPGHWIEVREIHAEAIQLANFRPLPVWETDFVGVIQSRIVQRLYEDSIVVCDISGLNANVMFELGLRLAFDKPTIIVMDSETKVNFDLSPFEYINYPHSLNYRAISLFQRRLSDKLKATSEEKKRDDNYSPYLKHFGSYIAPRLEKKEVDIAQFLSETMSGMEARLLQVIRLAAPDTLSDMFNRIDADVSDALLRALRMLRPGPIEALDAAKAMEVVTKAQEILESKKTFVTEDKLKSTLWALRKYCPSGNY